MLVRFRFAVPACRAVDIETSEKRLPVDFVRLQLDAEGDVGGRKMSACNGWAGAVRVSELKPSLGWNREANDMVSMDGSPRLRFDVLEAQRLLRRKTSAVCTSPQGCRMLPSKLCGCRRALAGYAGDWRGLVSLLPQSLSYGLVFRELNPGLEAREARDRGGGGDGQGVEVQQQSC